MVVEHSRERKGQCSDRSRVECSRQIWFVTQARLRLLRLSMLTPCLMHGMRRKLKT